MNMKKKNFILIACLAVFAALVLYWMKDYPAGTIAIGYGPAFYPTFLLIVLGLLCLILLFQTLLGKGDAKEDEKEEKPEASEIRHQWLMMLIFAVMGLVYALLLNTLGFIVISVIMVFIGMKLMGGKTLPAAVISVLAVAVLYVIFKVGFKVQLPDGILGGIL